MPIVRTYQCGDCFHRITVTLDGSEWDAPPPDCPACAERDARPMQQEFKPLNIGGSNLAKARKLAEKIAEEDYGVADFKAEGKEGHAAKVRYKDVTPAQLPSSWGHTAAGIPLDLGAAMASGREVRTKHGGSGLDILQRALKDGSQPDLIEVSKRNMARIYAK